MFSIFFIFFRKCLCKKRVEKEEQEMFDQMNLDEDEDNFDDRN